MSTNQSPKQLRSSDADWENFGAHDPYFAVLADPKFHADAITEGSRDDFFASGERYIGDLFAAIGFHLGAESQPVRALDFGCGVGRLLIPLASRFAHVVGVDVSPSMLEEARKNCRDLSNVSLARSDDALSQLDGTFDFINSYIVLQHIPVARGERIFARLIDRLNPGGTAAIHLTYGSGPQWEKRMKPLRRFPPVNWLANLLLRQPLRTPNMQMNAYSMNRIFSLLQSASCRDFHLFLTDHGGYRGCLLLLRKPSSRNWQF